jgi:F420-dependent oxidoreductase-like protein
MRIGLQIPNFTYQNKPPLPIILKDIVQLVDENGFYSLWVMDHFFQIDFAGPPQNEMMESYTTLGYFAGLTKNVKLGALVTGITYRYPGILIKTVTTLDVVSNGRAYFGVGAAWFEREAKGLGVPFPPVAERFKQLEEVLQIAKQMWSGNQGAYNGSYYQLAETITNPLPISKPHPPIMIGGTGEKKTLKLVAQYGDACNLFLGMGVPVLQQKLDVLKQHCENIGRPYEEIEKTGLGSIGPDGVNVSEVLSALRQYRDLGFTHCIFNFATVQDLTPLEVFAKEIIPAVKDW